MINHAIGAAGVVSQECKAVVAQYGQSILELLLAEVSTVLIHSQQFFLGCDFSGMSEKYGHIPQ